MYESINNLYMANILHKLLLSSYHILPFYYTGNNV